MVEPLDGLLHPIPAHLRGVRGLELVQQEAGEIGQLVTGRPELALFLRPQARDYHRAVLPAGRRDGDAAM